MRNAGCGTNFWARQQATWARVLKKDESRRLPLLPLPLAQPLPSPLLLLPCLCVRETGREQRLARSFGQKRKQLSRSRKAAAAAAAGKQKQRQRAERGEFFYAACVYMDVLLLYPAGQKGYAAHKKYNPYFVGRYQASLSARLATKSYKVH